MKCHICDKEMRIVKSTVLYENDATKGTIETWKCDQCDGLFNTIKRVVKSALLLLF